MLVVIAGFSLFEFLVDTFGVFSEETNNAVDGKQVSGLGGGSETVSRESPGGGILQTLVLGEDLGKGRGT